MAVDIDKIKSDDAAFQQFLRNQGNIDLNPYERKEPKEETTAETPKRSPSRKPAKARKASREKTETSGDNADVTLIRIHKPNLAELKMARTIYEMCEGETITMEDFIMALFDKGLKKVSPKSGALWEKWKSIADNAEE